MKNLLRILMFVLIIVAVFFASDFLINQNENYDLEEPTNVEETVKTDVSGDEVSGEVLESGETVLSGDTEVSGEVLESGDIIADDAESGDVVLESGDSSVSGEVVETETVA